MPPTASTSTAALPIPSLAWGAHLCAFWTSVDALLTLSATFVADGLHGNERAFWFLPDGVSEARAMETLRRRLPDADQRAAAGQLILIPRTDAPRHFNWIESIGEPRAAGYEGVRIAGDEGREEFDVSVNDLGGRRFKTLCSVPMTRCAPAEIFDLLSIHEGALLNTAGDEWRSFESEITRRKTRELSTIIDAVPGLVAYVDRDQRYRFANARYEEWFGLSPAAIVGKTVAELTGAKDFEKVREHVEKGLRGEAVTYRAPLSLGSRNERLLHIQYVPDVGPEGPRGYYMLAQDVTDIQKAQAELARRADDLARSNKELEQFAFVASHDLKEPLRKIAGYAELLTNRYREKLDEKANRYLDYLQDGVRRMDAIIGDLLAYSRAGRGKETREDVDMGALVKEILKDLELSKATVDVGSLPTVRVNPVQIRQVLQNLLVNALKFRRGESVEVRVSADRMADDWRFSIEDNGIGIESEYFDRIFEIFQRLHTRTEYPGTGIGLAICKKIVEAHGGRIWVDSRPGEGSAFHFTLPAV